MAATVLTTFVSLFVGGMITWIVSRQYYRKASEDLREEASALREQTNVVLRALQEHSITGNVEYNTNPDTGEPEGIVIRRTVNDPLGTTDNAQPELSNEDRDADEQN